MNQIARVKSFLAFYRRIYSEAVSYALGEGLCFDVFQEKGSIRINSISPNLLIRCAENMSFFINHFTAENGAQLVNYIYENRVIKKYPFLITCLLDHKILFGKGEGIQETLIIDYLVPEHSIVISDGKHKINVPKEMFIKVADSTHNFKEIEWYIFIPPVKTTKIEIAGYYALIKVAHKFISSNFNEICIHFSDQMCYTKDEHYIEDILRLHRTRLLFSHAIKEITDRAGMDNFDNIVKNFEISSQWWHDYWDCLVHKKDSEHDALSNALLHEQKSIQNFSSKLGVI